MDVELREIVQEFSIYISLGIHGSLIKPLQLLIMKFKNFTRSTPSDY